MNPVGVIFELNLINAMEQRRERMRVRLQNKYLRDISNPFSISDKSFMKMYRLPKYFVLNVLLPEISPYMRESVRNTYVPIHLKLLAVLNFISQGSYQTSVGKDLNLAISQAVVCRSIKEITKIFTNTLLPRYVKFPTTANHIRQVKQEFMEKYSFPDVFGTIDCTHIAIIAPFVENVDEPAVAYLNRKGYYSINVQAICDANLKFLSVNARYPGATHDAAIWTVSTINHYLRNQYLQGRESGWLLGDSGYPLQPWMMTPIENAEENTPEYRYTQKHIRARNTIERAFGVLKQRFRCLLKHRVLHYSHSAAGKIIYTCIVLHNLCRDYNIPDIENDEDDESSDDDDDDNDNENINDIIDNRNGINWLVEGRRIRNEIIERIENII